MILVMTNHPYLRAGCHSWYQRNYGYNTLHTTYIRTIVVSTGGKLTGFYFPHLLSIIYYFVRMHLEPGKKVSYLSPGDVNPRPFLSRRC
jgi:hypothetical protein